MQFSGFKVLSATYNAEYAAWMTSAFLPSTAVPSETTVVYADSEINPSIYTPTETLTKSPFLITSFFPNDFKGALLEIYSFNVIVVGTARPLCLSLR